MRRAAVRRQNCKVPAQQTVERDEPADVDLSKPPRGMKISRSLISGIDISYRRFQPAVLFLIPFTAVWSGFSLLGIYGSQISSGRFDPVASLAGLPFLLGTVVLVLVILHMLFGGWRLHIDRGTIRIFVGVGPFGRRREMTLGPGAKVHVGPGRLRRGGQRAREILIEDEGRHLNFGATLPEEVRDFLVAVLRQAVRTG